MIPIILYLKQFGKGTLKTWQLTVSDSCVCIQGPAMADKTFIDEIVKSHNEYRKRHQADSLSHSRELSAQAQKWADHLAATGTFQHSNVSIKGEKLGENIAMKWSSRPEAYSGL